MSHLFHSFHPSRLFTLLASALLMTLAHAQTIPSIAPTGGIWSSGSGFAFDLGDKKALKTRQSVSGIACAPNAAGQAVCLVTFDEGVQARWATLGAGTLQPDPAALPLRADTGELDAEGAATDGRYFYVTGSHSAKRKDCESNPHSRHVIRFQRDPVSGKALPGPGGALAGYADTGRLWSVMQALPALQARVGACLAAAGINFEGLAVRDGRLYFGLRGTAGDAAGVLAADADALFGSADVRASFTPLALGAGRGIRDMLAVNGGFLLLAGPDDVEAHQSVGWTLAWWNGQPSATPVTPKTLARLDLGPAKLRDGDKETKPEAIALLQETATAYQVLVLSDGMHDGGPLAFTVPK